MRWWLFNIMWCYRIFFGAEHACMSVAKNTIMAHYVNIASGSFFMAWVFVLCVGLQRLHTAGTRMCCGCMCVGLQKPWHKKLTAPPHKACVLWVLCVGSSLSRACAVGFRISILERMIIFDVFFQVFKIICFVTFCCADVTMSRHNLNLTKII